MRVEAFFRISLHCFSYLTRSLVTDPLGVHKLSLTVIIQSYILADHCRLHHLLAYLQSRLCSIVMTIVVTLTETRL